ncbi:MAG: ArsR/SmtB family transcription factor [Thermodesulfobacteriota bacterium]|jgi:ArsR family transcriptional regulator
MNAPSSPRPVADHERRARIIKALAHPSRLLMVETLAAGPRCVCELRELVGADLSTVSKHLTVLKNACIVIDERRGKEVYYHLTAPCVLDFFACIEALCRTRQNQLQQEIPDLRNI